MSGLEIRDWFLWLIQGYGLLRAGSAQDSGRDYEFFLAFDDKAGHNFIGMAEFLLLTGILGLVFYNQHFTSRERL